MITLYSGPVSWFARKVEIILREKQLPFRQHMVAFSQTKGYIDKPEALLRINPKGQVPVLIDGDVELYDSTVIIEYLEDAYPNIPVFPQDAGTCATMRLWDVFADEVMLQPIRKLMHRTEPRDHASESWRILENSAEAAAVDIERHLDRLEKALRLSPYLCGAFSAADIACVMAVFWSQRLAGPSFAGRDALRHWYHRLLQHDSVGGVISEILTQDRKLSAPVAGAYPDGLGEL